MVLARDVVKPMRSSQNTTGNAETKKKEKMTRLQGLETWKVEPSRRTNESSESDM